VFKLLQSIFLAKTRVHEAPTASETPETPPETLSIDGAAPFPFASHISIENGFPYVDWSAVESWVTKFPSNETQGRAWSMCERAWLLHLRAALGPSYRLSEAGDAMLISSLDPNVARATLEFMNLTLRRIVHALNGVAAVPESANDILIVFDDHDGYYKYVSHYYPEQGEFAASGGMYLHSGCSHFVTVKSDMYVIEPVIVHEMTHSCVAHLPLPAWLNEGIAVNMERRLGYPGSSLYTAREMHRKHLEFWGESEIQEFWSGKSFLRADEGNTLSYDLARIIVEQMAKDWEAFRDFVLAADRADAGSAAAHEHLELGLEECVCAILEIEESSAMAPDPTVWDSEPEKGGFSAVSTARIGSWPCCSMERASG
jgi:hypothetical protein